MKSCIIIPARLHSTRLPKKILADIHGKPMIVHTYERAIESNIGDVFLAISEPEVEEVLNVYNIPTIMTDPKLPSGTDRIFAAYRALQTTYDIIVNLQGDMPLISPDTVRNVLIPFKNYNCDISTVVRETESHIEINDTNTVKAVVSFKNNNIGKALYFTRSPSPYNGPYYVHYGIYAYTEQSLEKFVSFPQSLLEKNEKLEQLRALENDLNIYCIKTSHHCISVDVQYQLDIVRNSLQ